MVHHSLNKTSSFNNFHLQIFDASQTIKTTSPSHCIQRALGDNYRDRYKSELTYATHLFGEYYLPNISKVVQSYIDYDKPQRNIFIQDYFSISIRGSSHIFAYH